MPTTTQTKRRLTFGLNVLIGVCAATALAALVCWFTAKNPRRWDLTHTRQYSLSEQTLAVLTRNLTEPHEVVTLFNRPTADMPGRGEQVERANDLIDEYARRSKNLRVEHINPDTDQAKVTALKDRIRARYKAQLDPVVAAISRGADAARALREAPKKIAPLMTKLQQDAELKNSDVRDYLQRAVQAFAGIDASLERNIAAATAEPAKELPNFSGSINVLRTTLSKVDSELLAVLAAQLKQPSVTEGATVGVRDQVLAIIDEIEKARKPVQEALTMLRGISPVEDYEKLREQLLTPDTILIMGPKRETVVLLDEMFRQVDPKEREANRGEGSDELAFLGEERLTGALMSLSMKVRPKVVFVYSGRRPATGPGGNYSNVASRLAKLNFVVEQWTPGPRPGYMGQPSPPVPPPTAEPGQKIVWVVLPSEPADERNPMGGRLAEQALQVVTERLNAGDSAMFILAPSPTARFNPTDPIVQALELYKLKPLTDRVVLREIAVKSGQTEASNRLDVSAWPDTLPITKAIGGLNGVFLQALPIEAIAGKNADIATFPLVQVALNGLWAEQDLMSFPKVKRKPENSAESFVIAMASQTKTNRVIAVGDPVWASDEVTGYGILGPGTAEMGGAVFPANAELFVNSMYWLSNLEDLIAASPRSQDIRRVGRITPNTYYAIKWGLIAGLPLLAAGLGIAVYFVRRRA